MATKLQKVQIIGDMVAQGIHQGDGDDDFWGPPKFTGTVQLGTETVTIQNVEREQLKLYANFTWLEPKDDMTEYDVNINKNLGKPLPEGWSYIIPDGDDWIAAVNDVDIEGTNEGLKIVYDGKALGNKLVEWIKATGDKNGRKDTPTLRVHPVPNISLDITDGQ